VVADRSVSRFPARDTAKPISADQNSFVVGSAVINNNKNAGLNTDHGAWDIAMARC
jgi:hypothetical protein